MNVCAQEKSGFLLSLAVVTRDSWDPKKSVHPAYIRTDDNAISESCHIILKNKHTVFRQIHFPPLKSAKLSGRSLTQFDSKT